MDGHGLLTPPVGRSRGGARHRGGRAGARSGRGSARSGGRRGCARGRVGQSGAMNPPYDDHLTLTPSEQRRQDGTNNKRAKTMSDRVPHGDCTNNQLLGERTHPDSEVGNIYGVGNGAENIVPNDPIERRRKYNRDWYAAMTDEQRDRRNAKRRESYARTRAVRTTISPVPEPNSGNILDAAVSEHATPIVAQSGGNITNHTGSLDADDFGQGWLFRNNSICDVSNTVNSITGTSGRTEVLRDGCLESGSCVERFEGTTSDVAATIGLEDRLRLKDRGHIRLQGLTEILRDGFLESGRCVDQFEGTTSNMAAMISPEDRKRLRDRERYGNMSPTSKQKKCNKISGGRNRMTLNCTAELNVATNQSAITIVEGRPVTRSASKCAAQMDIDADDNGVEEEDLDCQEPAEGVAIPYEDDEARVFHQKVVQFKTTRDPDIVVPATDPYEKIYTMLPKKHYVLRKVPPCEWCGAFKFPREGEGFCCRKGRVTIHIPIVPEDLQRLFTDQVDPDALYFLQNIRYFNSHFSFTSFGASVNRHLATAAGTGVYCFKVHGQIYHKIDPLRPGVRGPRHMQLYFYDTDETLKHRSDRSPHLDKKVLHIVNGTQVNNPYGLIFQQMGHHVQNLDDYVIELNTSISVDQRRYNAPAMDQVAAIWEEGTDSTRKFSTAPRGCWVAAGGWRRTMREPLVLVREAMAEHLEERQAGWAYSHPGCPSLFSLLLAQICGAGINLSITPPVDGN